MKRPSFQFYAKEWVWDIALRQCSIAARGLWIDLLCLMHEGTPYGHLADERGALSLEFILRVAGIPEKEYARLLDELESKGVSGRAETGVMYSRRMVRDEERRNTPRTNGKRGGRPIKVLVSGGEREGKQVIEASVSHWEAFRAIYPAHRFDEQMACQMFVSRCEDEAILSGLKRAVASDDWRKDEGKFVPWASKFIAEGKYTGFRAPAADKKPTFFDPDSITRGKN
jgi:hypothetical protein